MVKTSWKELLNIFVEHPPPPQYTLFDKDFIFIYFFYSKSLYCNFRYM